eukprot:6016377-Pyramimonas_sp.AAC.1
MCLVDEEGHMGERALNQAMKSRSRAASRKALEMEAVEETDRGDKKEIKSSRSEEIREEVEESPEERRGGGPRGRRRTEKRQERKPERGEKEEEED